MPSKIQPFASWITKNIHHVYKGKYAFLWLPTSFGKSVCYKVLSFACLAVNKVRYLQVTGQGSYAVILLVPLLGSLTIAKFNSMSVHCFVVALFQLCTYILLSNILSIYYCTWTVYVKVTILRKYNRNIRTYVSSRYQAVFFLPHGLGTRLDHSISLK